MYKGSFVEHIQQQRDAFTQPLTAAKNRRDVVGGRTWSDAHCLPNHATVPPASVVKYTLPQIYWAHRTTLLENEWQRFIWLRPPYKGVCMCVFMTAALNYQLPGGVLCLLLPLQTSLYGVCVTMCRVFTSVCVFARTSLLGVNWTGSTMLGLGPGPSPLHSGSSQFNKSQCHSVNKTASRSPRLVFAR